MAPQAAGGGYYATPPQAQQIQPPPYLNLTKRFVKWNAYYSCGFDIPDGHTSQTCPQHLRKPDHDIHFTRQNAQQYIDQGYICATKNRHKTVFPQTMLWAMVGNVAFKCNETFSVISTVSDPTQMFSPISELVVDDDDITVVTSNVSDGSTMSLESAFPCLLHNRPRNGHTL
jgi:hypothetical protein